jgi:ribonuclease P protein subunit POP4
MINQEFIGQNIEIIKSSNKSLTKMKGTIVDETKNTFRVMSNNKIKSVLKQSSVFKINNTIIDGNEILKRPEDRIKLKNKGTLQKEVTQ